MPNPGRRLYVQDMLDMIEMLDGGTCLQAREAMSY